MIMLGAFAVFALILAIVGVYGVMSYLVTQGTHDIVVGLIGAAALTRVMASLLFGISATDLVTFSAVPMILAVVAILATYLPAWRATRVDPVVALRDQ